MAEPRRIAVISNSDAMVAAFRARIAELNITYSTANVAAGLPDRYVEKLLCDPPVKGLGWIAMAGLLGALGLRLELVEDPDAIARFRSLLEPRRRPPQSPRPPWPKRAAAQSRRGRGRNRSSSDMGSGDGAGLAGAGSGAV